MLAGDKYRPRDPGNVHDACKSALDALQTERVVSRGPELHLIPGAGVVVADDAEHLTLGAPGGRSRWTRSPTRACGSP